MALVGSGEFLPGMADVDRELLNRVTTGGGRVRVAILPTASAEDADPGSFERWGQMGSAHFDSLGAEVFVVPIRDAAGAHDPANVALLEAAHVYYFSGGIPDVIVEAFAGSPAWDTIARRYSEGAVYAGCSAGAMAAGPATPRIREVFAHGIFSWMSALGLVSHLCVLPHFDRTLEFMTAKQLADVVASVPPGTRIVGIDEQVALVGGLSEWQIMGRADGGVTVFDGSVDAATRYPVGARLRLEP
jgi:cyanophycinase-like exopeptidase